MKIAILAFTTERCEKRADKHNFLLQISLLYPLTSALLWVLQGEAKSGVDVELN